MSRVEMYSDPGVGNKAAPVGTVEWAQRVRLTLQSVVDSLAEQPDRFRRYYEIINEHRAWTLLNKEDGTFFRSFEEFCEHRKPWGLGKRWAEVEPYLVIVAGKRTVDLITAPPAQPVTPPPAPGPGRGKKKAAHHDDGKLLSEPKTTAEDLKAQRLRAVLRAPEPVQTLYREGLIGQVEAAALGPHDPEPEQAARIVEVTRAIAPIAEAGRGKPELEKKRVQRAVNAKVRELTGRAKAPKPEPAAPAAPRRPSFVEVTDALAGLSADDLRAVVRHAQTLLAAKGVSVTVVFGGQSPQ